MLMKLMKYELIRRKNSLAVFFGTLLTLEVVSLIAINRGGKWIVLFIGLMFFVIIGASLFVVYDNIKLLSDDLNNTSGYMLFMTPNHGYNITAAKMIIGFIEVTVTFLLVALLYYINFKYLDSLYNITTNTEVQMIFSGMTEVIKVAEISLIHIVYLILTYVLGWFVFITTVYISIILRKTLFSNSKFNGLFSFLIFVALNVLTGLAGQLISVGYIAISRYKGFMFSNILPASDPVFFREFMMAIFNISNIINLVIVVGFFWGCGYLLTKRVDL